MLSSGQAFTIGHSIHLDLDLVEENSCVFQHFFKFLKGFLNIVVDQISIKNKINIMGINSSKDQVICA